MSRIDKVNAALQQIIAEILFQKLEVPLGLLLTVTRVDCSTDMKNAKAYISVLPFDKSEEGMHFLTQNRKEIQSLFGKKVKIKYTPILRFILDDSEEAASKIYQALDNLE